MDAIATNSTWFRPMVVFALSDRTPAMFTAMALEMGDQSAHHPAKNEPGNYNTITDFATLMQERMALDEEWLSTVICTKAGVVISVNDSHVLYGTESDRLRSPELVCKNWYIPGANLVVNGTSGAQKNMEWSRQKGASVVSNVNPMRLNETATTNIRCDQSTSVLPAKSCMGVDGFQRPVSLQNEFFPPAKPPGNREISRAPQSGGNEKKNEPRFQLELFQTSVY
ncbi:hypothetical protein T265_06323 [Opisthorchis viverrini]|uniref:Uncharacterized protein n=1 Tax=Opisthorchis viverrini TaxID=6198 RepID=A0A074ZKU3_OPIVI|nr:hypothetical protein T265_06323 [Opisthorchis viverrini]KER26402.1 hypothetical protein T265_06323 [Opisthorchis viverrini]